MQQNNPAITIKVIWQAMTKVFQEAKLETPVADARLLTQHAVGMTHEEMLMNGGRIVSPDEINKSEEVMQRRLSHEPVSRIIGRRAFWKADFIVTPDVLDPRADSETLIEATLHHVKDPKYIIDIGTGTGCLLLSLLHEYQNAKGVGIDISEAAIKVAMQNAVNLKLESRAEFLSRGWADFKRDQKFDLIISNPPYIGLDEKQNLAPDVLNFDPHLALFAGADGLEAYREIIQKIPALLASDGYVIFEIGHTQEKAVKDLLAGAGFNVLEVRRDLGGNPRAIVAKKH